MNISKSTAQTAFIAIKCEREKIKGLRLGHTFVEVILEDLEKGEKELIEILKSYEEEKAVENEEAKCPCSMQDKAGVEKEAKDEETTKSDVETSPEGKKEAKTGCPQDEKKEIGVKYLRIKEIDGSGVHYVIETVRKGGASYISGTVQLEEKIEIGFKDILEKISQEVEKNREDEDEEDECYSDGYEEGYVDGLIKAKLIIKNN